MSRASVANETRVSTIRSSRAGSRADSLGSSRAGSLGQHGDVFMPEALGGRRSPMVSEDGVGHEAFQEDVEEQWVVSLGKEVYHSMFSITALKMTGVLVMLILCGTVETINYSVNGQRYMASYLTTLNVLVVFGATVFFSAIVGIKLVTDDEYYRDDATWTWKGEHATWFFRNIIGIAMCDTVALYMGILASHSVTAPMRTLLQQGSIPMSMLASFVFLGRRYKAVHVTGAAVIIVGILLAIYQIMTHGNPGVNHPQNEVETSDGTWTVIFFLSCIPLAIGSCLKEHVLTDDTRRVDMNQVNAWVALWQLVIGMSISPLSYMAANQKTSLDGFSENMGKGLQCGVWGDNDACNEQCAFVNTTRLSEQCTNPGPVHCDCGLSLAPLSVWFYVGVCCCFNLLMLYVIKEGTAVLFWISSAAIIPVVAIISSTQVYTWLKLGFVSFSILQICGLVLVVLGIAVYRSQPEEGPDTRDTDVEDGFDDARASIYHDIKHLTQSINSYPSSGTRSAPSSTGSPQRAAAEGRGRRPGHLAPDKKTQSLR